MKPCTPGSPEWLKRVAALRANEAQEPDRWWYLSFCDPEKPEGTQFLGACVVKARGMLGAVPECNMRGINPGGEVMALPVPDEKCPPPTRCHNYLMTTEEEIERLCAETVN